MCFQKQGGKNLQDIIWVQFACWETQRCIHKSYSNRGLRKEAINKTETLQRFNLVKYIVSYSTAISDTCFYASVQLRKISFKAPAQSLSLRSWLSRNQNVYKPPCKCSLISLNMMNDSKVNEFNKSHSGQTPPEKMKGEQVSYHHRNKITCLPLLKLELPFQPILYTTGIGIFSNYLTWIFELQKR